MTDSRKASVTGIAEMLARLNGDVQVGYWEMDGEAVQDLMEDVVNALLTEIADEIRDKETCGCSIVKPDDPAHWHSDCAGAAEAARIVERRKIVRT